MRSLQNFTLSHLLKFGLALLLATITLWSLWTTLSTQAQEFPPEGTINGTLRVEVFNQTHWQEVAELSYDKYLREHQLDLSNLELTGPVRLRIRHLGQTAAHIDRIRLGDQSPSQIEGTNEPSDLALKKLIAQDYDLIEATQKNLTVVFAKGADTLSVVARIEPQHITQTPFQFPLKNLYQPMTSQSEFYTYRWNSQAGTLTVDGDLKGEGLGQPFFKEFSRTGTGHPSDYTYGWVRNDAQNLYVALDFVSDNTMDGDKDYAKLYIHTPIGLHEFKVSVPEQSWGKPGFVYTPRAGYQHKVYEFAIPLSRLGLTELAPNDTLELAFAAYGTAGPPPEPNSYPGPLDPAFDGDGLVTTNLLGVEPSTDVAVQTDGKIVAVGYNYSGDDVYLTRYHPDGSLDTSFGTNGEITSDLGDNDQLKAIAIQDDGKIVAVGWVGNSPSQDVLVVRYTEDGNLDSTFGSNGVVITDLGTDRDQGYDLAIQGDGKIVVVARRNLYQTYSVIRYDSDGSLDTSFDTDGIVHNTDFGPYSVAIQDDGKIVLSGTDVGKIAVVRYNSDGTLDTSFGTNGIVTASLGTYDEGKGVVVQPDQKIVVAGYTLKTDYRFVLLRYLTDGSLDTSFDTDGIVTTDFGDSQDMGQDVALQDDGKIVVAGRSGEYPAAARYNSDGSLDTTFGTGGRANTKPDGISGRGYSLALQPDYKIVMGIGYYGTDDNRAALLRYGTVDLALSKTVTPTGTLNPGDTITYTLTFSNSGSAAQATGVIITDTLPSNISVQNVISSGDVSITRTSSFGAERFDTSPLASGQSGLITLTALISSSSSRGTFTNTATITTTSVESDTTNNTGYATIDLSSYNLYYLPLILKED